MNYNYFNIVGKLKAFNNVSLDIELEKPDGTTCTISCFIEDSIFDSLLKTNPIDTIICIKGRLLPVAYGYVKPIAERLYFFEKENK